MRRQLICPAIAAALLLSACGPRDEPESTGLTPSEAAQLNQAAAELDNQAGVAQTGVAPAPTQDPAP